MVNDKNDFSKSIQDKVPVPLEESEIINQSEIMHEVPLKKDNPDKKSG